MERGVPPGTTRYGERSPASRRRRPGARRKPKARPPPARPMPAPGPRVSERRRRDDRRRIQCGVAPAPGRGRRLGTEDTADAATGPSAGTGTAPTPRGHRRADDGGMRARGQRSIPWPDRVPGAAASSADVQIGPARRSASRTRLQPGRIARAPREGIRRDAQWPDSRDAHERCRARRPRAAAPPSPAPPPHAGARRSPWPVVAILSGTLAIDIEGVGGKVNGTPRSTHREEGGASMETMINHHRIRSRHAACGSRSSTSHTSIFRSEEVDGLHSTVRTVESTLAGQDDGRLCLVLWRS